MNPNTRDIVETKYPLRGIHERPFGRQGLEGRHSGLPF